MVLINQDRQSQSIRTVSPIELGPSVLPLNRKELKKETTTTGTNWEKVVVVLSGIVDRREDAIHRMQSRGGTPDEALQLVERWNALPDGNKDKQPGTLYHWFCRRPRPSPMPKPAQALKTPEQHREDHRTSFFQSSRSQLIRERDRPPSDDDLAILDTTVQDEMSRYDSSFTSQRELATAT